MLTSAINLLLHTPLLPNATRRAVSHRRCHGDCFAAIVLIIYLVDVAAWHMRHATLQGLRGHHGSRRSGCPLTSCIYVARPLQFLYLPAPA